MKNSTPHFHLRDEARSTERRAPLTPQDAEKLIGKGAKITVERSVKRIFSDEAYKQAGCDLVQAESWKTAPSNMTILGLKELPADPDKLPWAMIHFAHIYKDQSGWQNEIARFERGGGLLYDLEYLTNEEGRRVAAFGYWAGWMGAAMALWRMGARLSGGRGPEAGVSSFEGREQVEKEITHHLEHEGKHLKAVVIGAKGRSGAGAVELLEKFGVQTSKWDIEETRNLDREALLSHDILVNCVLMTGPGLRLLGLEDLDKTNLKMISDVSCDPFSDFNPLPVYKEPTSWETPYIELRDGIELTAIDNLPSMLPREASEDFSAQLLPTLLSYPDGTPWQNAKAVFDHHLKRAKSD
ncbi:MAG: saccharopine dehydrogenase [Sphingomonadales bacterium]|jgi:saccharopine dehydrogenase (NAD+, L-lysine-forming)